MGHTIPSGYIGTDAKSSDQTRISAVWYRWDRGQALYDLGSNFTQLLIGIWVRTNENVIVASELYCNRLPVNSHHVTVVGEGERERERERKRERVTPPSC